MFYTSLCLLKMLKKLQSITMCHSSITRLGKNLVLIKLTHSFVYMRFYYHEQPLLHSILLYYFALILTYISVISLFVSFISRLATFFHSPITCVESVSTVI